MKSFYSISLFILLSAPFALSPKPQPVPKDEETGILEKMIVANGTVEMDFLNAGATRTEKNQFDVLPDSPFTVVVFNDELRGPKTGGMLLTPLKRSAVPEYLRDSLENLEIARVADDSLPYELVVRDSKTGFVFFTVEGHSYDFAPDADQLKATGGRLLISEELARKLEKPREAGHIVGNLNFDATFYPIEVMEVVNGVVQGVSMPAQGGVAAPAAFPNQGPDVIVGDLPALQQFSRSGSNVGLAVGTTSCNKGNVPLHWFQLPNVDHPVIPMNLYRLKNDRFEQIGQSWLKHAFTALQLNACNFGCTPNPNGTQLGVGCSDPYDASLNSMYGGLGSRAWVNPFTGAFPNTANNHAGHSHSGVNINAHRLIVSDDDLNPPQNPDAMYYAESQYVTPHEYAYCVANGVCNMYNNASYRRFKINTGAPGGTWTFGVVGATVKETPAVAAWTGASSAMIEPVPGIGGDGRAFIYYKVTGPVDGLWHYEYAIYNQNLDRAIQQFIVPLGCGITISNVEFHAPQNPPGFANDGTGGVGFSNTPWASAQSFEQILWSTETLAQNTNANALRWGTLYNFRFDANQPPANVNATVGFFKTGDPMVVAIQGPAIDVSGVDCNGNGIADSCDILSGTSIDSNLNGIPDECEPAPCPWDLDGDGIIGGADLGLFLGAWGDNPGNAADFNGDGVVDGADLGDFLGHWGNCAQ